MKKIARILTASLCLVTVAICSTRTVNTYAVDKTAVDEANRQVEETKKKIQSLNNQLSSVGKDIDSVNNYIAQLDSAINELELNLAYQHTMVTNKQDEIENKNKEIIIKQKEIDLTEVELDDASKVEQKQYEDMKKRIQYMYESGDDAFLDRIFSSDDLADMLGNTEYVSSIVSYDRDQLQKLRDTKDKIKELLEKCQSDKITLENQKKDLENQQTELISMEKSLKDQKDYTDSAKKQKEDALDQLEYSQNYIQEQKRIEEAKLQQQQKEAQELARRWAEEVAKAQESGISADEANKRKLEEIGLAGGFKWPANGHYIITSQFGPRIHPITGTYNNHTGTDIAGYNMYGSPITACYSGTVIFTDTYVNGVDTMYTKPYGTQVQIDHGAGVVTLYAHMSALNVQQGQVVNAGDVIGFVGSTGASTGPHLHLTLYIKGVLANPLDYMAIPAH